MFTETALSIHAPSEVPSPAEQPLPPKGALARTFPTREEAERVQLRKLQALLEAIVPSNAFYARKLAACGLALGPLTPSLSPSDGKTVPFRVGEGAPADPFSTHGPGSLTLEAYRRLIPITTRHE